MSYKEGRALTIARGRHLRKKKNQAVARGRTNKAKTISEKITRLVLTPQHVKEDVNLSAIKKRGKIGHRIPKVKGPNYYGQKKI